MMSVGRWTCSIIQAIVSGLSRPRDPLEGLVGVASPDTLGEGRDRRRLVTRRLEWGDDLEFGA